MFTNLNKRQREWLATASEDEIKAFAAAGEPEVGNMINRQSFKEYFAAGIRGLRVSSTDHETADAAYDEAQAKRDEWRADAALPVLDERALGIDGLNTTLHDKLYEATLRTETILHLGAMFSGGDDMLVTKLIDTESGKRALAFGRALLEHEKGGAA